MVVDMRGRWMMGKTVALLVTGLSAGAALAATSTEWLSLCGKCLNPTVFAKSGIGTTTATAEARITRKDAEGWCENWEPQTPRAQCVSLQMSSDDAKKVHRATADCTKGRITAIDGGAYTLDGRWTSDVGRGRTRWRDKSGRVVGQDNASNGLAISQQWELLCPGTAGNAGAQAPAGSGTRAAAPPAAAKPPAPKGDYAVGQAVEAKYGREWIGARVTRIRETQGRNGPELAYDVQLDNGKRGIVPARMLRAAR